MTEAALDGINKAVITPPRLIRVGNNLVPLEDFVSTGNGDTSGEEKSPLPQVEDKPITPKVSFQMLLPKSVTYIKLLRSEGVVLTDCKIADMLLAEQAKIDPETVYHQRRVAIIAVAIGEAYGLKGKRLRDLATGARLHDIGKSGVPQEIIQKAGRLTKEEEATMKNHSANGKAIVHAVGMNKRIVQAVYQHHERMSGTGYPRHQKGNAINLLARIIAIADAVEAKTDPHRPYRDNPRTLREAGLDILRGCNRRRSEILYDRRIVRAAIKVHRENPGLWEEIAKIALPQPQQVPKDF